jgi:hypothetical protein
VGSVNPELIKLQQLQQSSAEAGERVLGRGLEELNYKLQID